MELGLAPDPNTYPTLPNHTLFPTPTPNQLPGPTPTPNQLPGPTPTPNQLPSEHRPCSDGAWCEQLRGVTGSSTSKLKEV